MPTVLEVQRHLENLQRCKVCPRMHKPVVVGRPVPSRIILVGQAPGDKEPILGRPFAWTAGKTLFKWFSLSLGWTEDQVRDRIYFAAVCRCFPGKKPEGGDRVPDEKEISACAEWLKAEIKLLEPDLILPVGKLAFTQFLGERLMNDTIGQAFKLNWEGREIDCIPLPHPSGASPWHRMEPGKTMLAKALTLLAGHRAVRAATSATCNGK